jgi:hypothetical protein
MTMYRFWREGGVVFEGRGEVKRCPDFDRPNVKCYMVTKHSGRWFIPGYRWHDCDLFRIDRAKALRAFVVSIRRIMNNDLDTIKAAKDDLLMCEGILNQANELK